MSEDFCNECNTKISNDFGAELEFCTNCGTRLAKVGSYQRPPKDNMARYYPPAKKVGPNYLLGSLGIVLLLFLVGIGLLTIWLTDQDTVFIGFASQYRCTIPGEPEPQTSDEYVERSGTHVKRNSGDGSAKFDDCVMSALSEAIRLDPMNAEAYRKRGLARLERHELDQAIADFDMSLEINPTESETYALRGLTYSGKGELDGAVADVTKAIELSPRGDIRLVSLYAVRGNMNANRGDHDQAILDYTEAIRLDPDRENIIYYMDRARAYRKLGEVDLANHDERKIDEIVAAGKDKGTTTDAPADIP